jgi:hypothetical protein
MPSGGVFVLDCLGKFNIHRFMNLLGLLKIRHSVLFDADNERPPHPEIKTMIENATNEFTQVIDTFPNDLEEFLGIDKCRSPHRKPQHVMLNVRKQSVSKEKFQSLVEKVEELIK